MDAISVAKIGNSDDLKIGEQVVAIGNALGYGQSVTTGIVSAKNRKTDSSGQIESSDSTDNSSSINKGVNLIQTDAAINPGNSGGALLNMDGEVVGINSSKLASTEVEGMGYAIAISDVADSLENMMNAKARDKVDNHGILGITGSTVSTEAVQIYGIPQGVFVSEVTEVARLMMRVLPRIWLLRSLMVRPLPVLISWLSCFSIMSRRKRLM